jgi:uncharacterized protein DUF1996
VSRSRAVIAVSLVVVAASVTSARLALAAEPSAPSLRELAGVNFVSACRFSHRAADDPIVFPGQPGRSHDHSFVGNTSTRASSTLRSLRRASSTCRRAGDTAAYWMPTLLVDGRPVEPLGATVYYRRRTSDEVRAFPAGLRMVAGDARATAPQGMRVTSWSCGAASAMPPSASVPTCAGRPRSGLRLRVTFPSCWNGATLDSADHLSHMAYSRGGRCPVTHPVAVPAITLIFRYPVAGAGDVVLASGGQFSAHADFFNAWDDAALASLVDGCLNALRHCGRGS